MKPFRNYLPSASRFMFAALVLLWPSTGLVAAEQSSRKPAPTRAAAAAAAVTNQRPIDMVTAGLPKDVIVNAIKQAAAREFDLRPDGLTALGEAKPPAAVIRVMQGGVTAPVEAASPVVPSAARPVDRPPLAAPPATTVGAQPFNPLSTGSPTRASTAAASTAAPPGSSGSSDTGQEASESGSGCESGVGGPSHGRRMIGCAQSLVTPVTNR